MYPTTIIPIHRSAAASVIPRTPVLYICLFLLVLVWPAAIQAAVITPPVTGESTLTVSTTEPQILQPPVIVAHPQSQVAYYGGTLELEVSASGTEPLTYQWFRNGFSIPAGTNRVLQFPNVNFDTEVGYHVKVSNSAGMAESEPAMITVEFLAGPVRNRDNCKIYYLLGRNSWSESEAAAVRLGGHLATVRNQAEQNWIFDTFTILSGVNRNLWIGLYDPDPLVNSPDSSTRRGEFQWSSGESSSYQNWAAIEPNNDGGGLPEMYVHMWRPNSPSAGRWNDIPDAPITNRPDNPWHGVVEIDAPRPIMSCPESLTLCPSDSTEPEYTGFPTILSSCSPTNEVILTRSDSYRFHIGTTITRRWTAYDPLTDASATCIQTIHTVDRDDPTITSSSTYGGMIATFEAGGTRGSIGEATWTLNGRELEEEIGNGIRFLNDSRSVVEIDFGLYTEVDPDSGFDLFVSVRTTCAQGGAGGGGTAPPIFTLSRTAASIPSSEVRTGNTSVNLQCENVDDDFSAQSRWFRFNVNEPGPASITVTDPSARVAVVTRGATITQLTTRACGLQTVYFPAEPGTTYIVVVESSSTFTLTSQIQRFIVNCPNDLSFVPCDKIDPQFTGSPDITACSSTDQIEVDYEDTFDPSQDLITRTWTVIDKLCKLTNVCEQRIFTQPVFLTKTPVAYLAFSEFDGLVQYYESTFFEGAVTSFFWEFNDERLDNTQPGVSFDSSLLIIDFTLFKNGAFASRTDFEIVYGATFSNGEHCTGTFGGQPGGGTAPPVYALSRGALPPVESSGNDFGGSYSGDCIPSTDSPRWFYFKAADSGVARVRVQSENGSPSKVAAIAAGLSVSIDEKACANNEVLFEVQAGKTYVVAVSQSASFTLQGVIEDSNPGIELQGNLAFGEVQVGNSVTNTLTIINTGNVPIAVSGLTFSVSGFSGNWTGTILPAVSQAVDIIFSPASPGNYPGNVNVISSVDPGSHTLPISGIGVPVPTRILLLTGDLNFAQVQAGSSSNRVLRITNGGNSTLTIQNLIPPVGFTLDWTSASIEPGTSKDLLVTFSPTAALVYDGELKIESNATSGPGVFPVSGTGVPIPTRSISLSGDLAFGDVPIGSASSKPLTISNLGNSPLKVLGIVYPSGFSGNWTGTITSGGSQMVNVTFTPAAALSYPGNLTVLSDATDGQNTHPVSGKGLSEALISLPPKIEFNNVQLGSSETRAILIRNVGDLPLTITDIAYPQNFTGSPGPMTIPAGGSTNLDVTFTPALPLPYSGNVNIDSDGTITLSLVQVTGAGFDLTFSAADLAIPANNSFRLPIQKEPNTEIIIEYSADLLEWIELGRNDAASGAVEYIDQYPPGTQLRFYRYRYLRSMN